MNKPTPQIAADLSDDARSSALHWVVFVPLLALVACSSDTPNDAGVQGETVERVGLTVTYPTGTMLEEHMSPWLAYVDLFQIASRPDTTGDILTELVQYDEDFSFAEHADFYENRVDVCNIKDLDAPDSGGSDNPMVSGGENLLLSSAGSTWVTVPYSVNDANYNGDDIFPAAVPSDLSLTLPGDVFPALSLKLKVPSVPVRLSPVVGDEITTASEYRWVPSSDSSQMRISFLSYLGDDFQGFPITCFVEDDGEFALPAVALAEVERRAGELRIRYTRDTRRLTFQNGVAVFSAVSIADD